MRRKNPSEIYDYQYYRVFLQHHDKETWMGVDISEVLTS